MLRLEYKNNQGTVLFAGSGYGKGVKIITITGLGLPKKNYKTIEFASENGVTQTGEKDMVRTITITADVYGNKKDCRHISRALHESGELFITSDDIRRKIICKCTQPPEFKKQGADIDLYTFTVQLQADYPYFTDFYNIETPIYQLENCVTTEFTLPCVFTKRTSKATLNNVGDKYVYPVLKILNLDEPDLVEAADLEDEAVNQIIISNHTTGAFIKINHIMQSNETITVFLDTRRIVSDIAGDITNETTDDTVLSDFYIDVGENELEFINTNPETTNLSAVVIYNPEYYTAEV